MYLRTTRRKNKDGSTVEYYQLAHNERHPDTRKPVARIIHSFGRADELYQDQLVRLCNSIARVCGLKVIDPINDCEQTQNKDLLDLFNDLKLRGQYFIELCPSRSNSSKRNQKLVEKV